MIGYYNVMKGNLLEIYNKLDQIVNYRPDGLLFCHKDSFYMHEVNEEVVLWKDNRVAVMLSQEMSGGKLLGGGGR